VTTIQLRKAPPQNADLIFVFAGRDYRKRYALELFKTRSRTKGFV
jgi:hypothetical protein